MRLVACGWHDLDVDGLHGTVDPVYYSPGVGSAVPWCVVVLFLRRDILIWESPSRCLGLTALLLSPFGLPGGILPSACNRSAVKNNYALHFSGERSCPVSVQVMGLLLKCQVIVNMALLGCACVRASL